MKLFIGLLFFLSILATGNAQTKITGKVMDVTIDQPLEYAAISIVNKQTKKTVNGSVADAKGAFEVGNIPPGIYKITVAFLGYGQKTIDSIAISNDKQKVSLGIIALNPLNHALGEVTVTGNAHAVENKIDKLVYLAANDVTSQGGVALDVLKNVPQVTVGVDGNVELQGDANIRFLINGKPSSMFGNSVTDALASIPASQIKSVEVVTSPGAKYDAQGTGGIINIILKENNMQGFNGVINASAGTRLENGSVNLNVRHNNFGVNAFFNGNAQLTSRTPNFQDRLGTDTIAKTTTRLLQDGYSDFTRNAYQSGLGFDWSITKKDNLSGSLSYRQFGNKNQGPTNLEQVTQGFSGDTLSHIYSLRNAESKLKVNSFDWNLSYKRKFNKEGQELDFLYTASYSQPNTDYSLLQSYRGQSSPYKGMESNNPGTNRENIISIDYAHPVNDHLILETGVKTILQTINSNANVYNLDISNGQYTIDPAQSYHLDYNMKVYAAYLSGTFSLFRYIDVSSGLRYEYTDVTIDFPNTHVQPYGNFVPSVIVSHTFGQKKQIVKLAYNQRIERAEYAELNPFVNLSDPYNISTGNPLLKPELGHNLTLSYSNTFDNGGSILVAVYERVNTQDKKRMNTYYPTYQVGDSVYHNVSYTNNQNIGEEYNSGFNISGSLPLGKLNLRSDLQIAHRFSETHTKLGRVNMGERYRLNLNATYQLPRNLIFEAFGNYNSSAKSIQGWAPQSFTYTFAFSKQFWNKKASFGFTATNPFNQYISQKSTVLTDNYTSYNIRQIPYRSFGISFSYKFGKLEFKKNKEEDNYLNGPPSMDN